MEFSGLMLKLYFLAKWIMQFAYINILWILFTLVGGVVLGFFPSTIGLFAVIRKWQMGETDIQVLKTYWKTFRSEFLKANQLGFMFLLIGCILYFDLRLFESLQGIVFLILTYLFIILCLIYCIALMYFFPVFVHFDLKKLDYLKQPFVIIMSSPLGSVFMVVGALVVYYSMIFIPGLIPFFGVSTMSFVLNFVAYRVFLRLQNKANHS